MGFSCVLISQSVIKILVVVIFFLGLALKSKANTRNNFKGTK